MRILSKLGLFVATGVMAAGVMGAAVVAATPNSHANAEATSQTDGSTKLADAKLKACQNREKAINNIMSKIAVRGQRQLDLFTTIAERVEKFYTDKGRTVSNYDTLVADVTAKKDAAQAAVDKVKDTSVTFKCDRTDPKGAAASFKESLKSEIAALKAYRTSVKNLIVGVKSAQSTSQDKTTDKTNTSEGGAQ